ncbi:MAG TPA: FCD domain-containing protein [Acidimicrobiales bacterium]
MALDDGRPTTDGSRSRSPLGGGVMVAPAPPAGDGRRKLKTSERVAVELVRDIAARGLSSGDRLPLEAAMLEEYGVSRASLREAQRLLEVQGLIVIRPGPRGGPVVGTVDPAHLAHTATLYFHLGAYTYRELFEAQVRLEPVCAELAARHDDRLLVRRTMEPFLARNGVQGPRAYRDAYVRFHQGIYVLAGNGVLTLLARAVTHVVTNHVVATMEPVELRPAIVDEHRALAEAVIAGRAALAYRLMEHHFAQQLDFYKRRWPSRFDEVIEWR